MEHDGELLPGRRQVIGVQVSICYGRISACLELAIVKFVVGILQNGLMGSEVLHQFDHARELRMSTQLCAI